MLTSTKVLLGEYKSTNTDAAGSSRRLASSLSLLDAFLRIKSGSRAS
jgi:hypothetical protein